MIYFIQDKSNRIKIGYTGKSADGRKQDFQTGNSNGGLTILLAIEGTKADEGTLHKQFDAYHACGEWFEPASELIQFILAQRDLMHEKKSVKPPMWITEDEWGDGEHLHGLQIGKTFSVVCPACGFNCIHHSNAKQDHELHVDGPTRFISFSGECGHNWSLCFGFHKGAMSVAVVVDESTEIDETELEDGRLRPAAILELGPSHGPLE